MKKTFFAVLAAFCICALTLSSCGTQSGALTSGSSNAGAAASTGSKSTAENVLGSLLGSLIGNAVPVSERSVVGAWSYQSPEVRFESEDFLSKAGGEVAAATIESKLAEIYTKVGIVPGSCQFVFAEDKSCQIVMGSKTIKGTYTLDTDSREINIRSTTGLLKLNGKVYLGVNSLVLLFDADKVLTVAKALSAITGQGSSTIAAAGSMLDKYNGLMLGMNLKK